MVSVTIDGIKVKVPEGSTIYEAAKKAGIHIPTFCYHQDIKKKVGACRICLVEVEGMNDYVPSCSTPVKDGMVVRTNTKELREIRKFVLTLLLGTHKQTCPSCVRNQNCDLLDLSHQFNMPEELPFPVRLHYHPIDASSYTIVREPDKCILCGRCEAVCTMLQNVSAIGRSHRGIQVEIAPPFDLTLEESPCVGCGQCLMVCPVGAIYEKDSTEDVWNAIYDPNKVVIAQTAPAVRVAIGEEFGLEPGAIVTGKMVTGLKLLGFDYVFDTQFGADLTIMEEGTELTERLENGGPFPLLTSCCPAWVKFVEEFHHDMLENISSAMSPQQMTGALTKTYFAEKMNIDPKNIVVVSIMPCTAKKAEIERPELTTNGMKNVDYVITTRELARMLKQANINLVDLPESTFDNPLGESTGAAAIFGVTGGVMEAALRSAYEFLTGKELTEVEFKQIRGFEKIRVAEIEIDGKKVKVAVANTLGAADELLRKIKEGDERLKDIVALEVMACPGGCLGGGGQPIPTTEEIRIKRAQAIYKEDKEAKFKKSHENPAIKQLYDEFLEKPLSKIAHKLLHTYYQKREKYKVKI
ncbi:MAG: (2Fe-2S)-binding protein [Thermotogaceae bacterium]|nr:(2Fe-2S)-binding protein [Thermotogaceae bacterium]